MPSAAADDCRPASSWKAAARGGIDAILLTHLHGDHRNDRTDPPTAPLTWGQRLKRVFEIDITLCPHCGWQLRVIAG